MKKNLSLSAYIADYSSIGPQDLIKPDFDGVPRRRPPLHRYVRRRRRDKVEQGRQRIRTTNYSDLRRTERPMTATIIILSYALLCAAGIAWALGGRR